MKNIYYYCTIHKQCVLPEDKNDHGDDGCTFTIEEFKWTPPKGSRKQWVAKSIVEKERMIPYKLPKPTPKVYTPTIPENAITIDTPSFTPKLL